MTRIRVALMSLVLVLVTSSSFAQGSETVVYFHADAIGSTRLVTDANGQVLERYDYLPFGEPYPPSAPVVETRRFGGKERDVETGLDYFGARYYSSLNGRFGSVDPLLNVEQAILDPQRWNRYAYAQDNPFRFVDPDGRDTREVFYAVQESLIGYGKETANTVIGLANLTNRVVDAAISPLTDFRFGQIKTFESGSQIQGQAMLAMAVVGTVATGGGSSEAKLVSAIGKDDKLIKLAEEAGTSVQRSIDALTKQLGAGNLNPGIGTKNLFGNISYARARDGARVFFRKAGNTIEILAKASKQNEDEVIRRLEDLYK
jgi:RHS repeat-associated protein